MSPTIESESYFGRRSAGIPLFATWKTLEPLLPEIGRRQQEVLRSGRYVLGPEVEAFERELADYVGRRHCIGVGSGTDALVIALRTLGVGAGDEVIVPDITFFATAEAVALVGARPVFCDIDPKTFCITAETASPHVSERTAALLPVHLFGNPAPMTELAELAESAGAALIGDAAQAAGAQLGGRPAAAHGEVAIFSFYPSKNLSAFGDGGAIVTDDDEFAAQARRLRTHCAVDNGTHTEVGYNSRLDEIQAAGLRVLLPRLERWTSRRREIAGAYAEGGLGERVELARETQGGASAFHLYVVLAEHRDELAVALRERGVGCRAYYTTPMSEQPAFAALDGPGGWPASARFTHGGLALPMGPDLDQQAINGVIEAVFSATDSQRPSMREPGSRLPILATGHARCLEAADRAPLRVAVLGYGHWGPNLARVVARGQRTELAAICDRSEEARARAQSAHPTARVSGDWDAVASDASIDAVVVALPVNLHFRFALEALEAGKHVMVEKPLAGSVAECDTLIAAANERGLTLMAGHSLEYHAGIVKIKDYLDDGELGEPYYVTTRRTNLGIVRSDTNAMWNLAPHDVSIICFWLDREPQSVVAQGLARLQTGIEDVVFLTIRFDDEILCNVHCSWVDPNKARDATVVGSEKMVVYDDMSPEAKVRLCDKGIVRGDAASLRSLGRFEEFGRFQPLARAGDVLIPKVELREPLAVEIEDFAESVCTGREPRSGPTQARRVVAVLEAADRSLETGIMEPVRSAT